MRFTFVCPEVHAKDANDLAMVLAYSKWDGSTYLTPNYQDVLGNKYIVASTTVEPAFVPKAQAPLVRPAWDVLTNGSYVVNMAGARRAQALVVLVDPANLINMVTATPTTIMAYPHEDPQEAIRLMGLTPIPTPLD